MNKPLRILILEDNAADAELMESELIKAELEFSARRVHSRDEFLKALAESPPELVLSDYAIPGFSGLEALKRLREQYADLPVIFVSGTIGEEEAVELMRLGATDFVPKTRLDKLVPAIQRALREMEQREEKRRAETSLRESEARFRAVFEGASAGIAIEDLQGQILQTNRSLQQMLGYGAVELAQITRRDFTHTQDHKEETAHFKRLLAGSSDHYQVEKRFVRRDGRIFWGRLTVSMVRDPAGHAQFPVAMIEDITERQRAEEAHQQHAAIVESSNDAIISSTFDGIIFSWNPAAERLCGYSPSEANGRPVSIYVPPEQEEELQRALDKIRRGERVENFETVRRRKEGLLIHVSVTLSAIKDLAGRVIGVSSMSRDITERKRAEEALRESEANYRKLVELSPDAIFIHCDGRHVYFNSAGFKLFGVSHPDQIIGKPVLDFVHPDFHETVKERIAELTSGRQGVPLMEQKIVRVDGVRWTWKPSRSVLSIGAGRRCRWWRGTSRSGNGRWRRCGGARRKSRSWRRSQSSIPMRVLEFSSDGELILFQ